MDTQTEKQKSMWKRFTASLHTHVKSIFDAQIEADQLCAKIKELGGKGCAITDHGVLTSILDYKEEFDKEGLKLVPGTELYLDGDILGRLHLIFLAKNDHGYIGVGKLVTEANYNLHNGFPVLTMDKLSEIMKEYKGDIIATSACMQGVIAQIFLQNKKVDKIVAKLRTKQENFTSPNDSKFQEAKINLSHAEEDLQKAIVERDDCKYYADMKFTAREKSVKKLEKKNDETAVSARAKLEEDKEKSRQAKGLLDSKKAAVVAARKAVSSAEAALKDFNESVSKFMAVEDEITEVSKNYKIDDELMDLAVQTAMRYQDIFGADNFYAEVQYHGIEEESICFPKTVEVAKKLNMPFVATNDVHILTNSEDDRLRRQILRSMRFGEAFEEEYVGDDQLYLKDNNELADALLKILPIDVVTEAINNIELIFDQCDVQFITGKHYPEFPTEDGRTTEQVFMDEIQKGIIWRFPEGMDEEHKKRLDYEIGIIKSMGYIDYHLIVKDFLEYGRLLGFVPKEKINEAPLTIKELEKYIADNGWKNGGLRIGPGRGSAVGSLVCYLLGITNLDPIPLGLLFEREEECVH